MSCLSRLQPAYEYPIGIGIWTTYCTVDTDCPLYDVEGPMNRTQRCVPYGWIDDGSRNEDGTLAGRHGNPGKGFQHFDNILWAWVALFINMANLYWWETAHRVVDANSGLGSIIGWHYGLVNVFLLTYISVNMFVAVITTIFADVRSAENPDGGMVAKAAKTDRDYDSEDKWPKWNKPFYYVQGLGGKGGPYEAKRRLRKKEQNIVQVETEAFQLEQEFKSKMKKIVGQPALGIEKEKPPMSRVQLEKELQGQDLDVDGDDADLMDRLMKVTRDQKFADDEELKAKLTEYRWFGLDDGETHGFINGSLFNNFIMLFILLNTVALAWDGHDEHMCCVTPGGIPGGHDDYCTEANSKCTTDVIAGIGNDLHTGRFINHTRYPDDFY
eukprot:SAG31_NODE_7983_length_1549_cov_1.519310_1_plen_383_part_10